MAKIQINMRKSLLLEDFFNHGAIIIVAFPYYFSIIAVQTAIFVFLRFLLPA